VQTIERTAIVRFENTDLLFEATAVVTAGQKLHRLIEEEGASRLVVNFAGVQHLSSEVLGILAGLQSQFEPRQRRIVLCGLNPLMWEMVRITHLDRVFDVCRDEVEALCLMRC
jgi:anti-anti-sigma factor